MGQRDSGVHRMLSVPWLYDAVQGLMGAGKGRREFVEESVRPAAGDRILDVGCGTARILSCLPRDVEYWGYDVSPAYIDAARARYGGRATFVCGELDEPALARLPRFDIVLGSGLLHHLEDEQARKFMTLSRAALDDDGRLVTIDPCFAPDQKLVARVLVRCDRGRNVRTPEGYRALAEAAFRRIGGKVRHRGWIPYSHWVMECRP